MSDAFHHGGWGMYPTTIAGLILIAVAVHYARRPDRARLGLISTLSRLTFLVSCLGFVTGVIRSFMGIADAEAHDVGRFVVVGVGESLNNIGLGLALLIVAAIATAIGKSRAGASGAELSDPHAS